MRGIVLIMVCVLALPIVAASIGQANGARAGSDNLTVSERDQLLRTYQPFVYYAADEWSPILADTFTGLASTEELNSKGRWLPYSGPVPSMRGVCNSKEKFCFRFNLKCHLADGAACYRKLIPHVTNWSHGYVYARLLDFPKAQPTPRGFERPRWMARYWFFYFFDDWHSPKELLWQAHEADWESVSFGLRNDRSAIFAAYSQHCSGTVVPYKGVQLREGHPVVYVALDSHANYFNTRTKPTYPLRCVYHYKQRKYLGLFLRAVKFTLERDRIVDQLGKTHGSGQKV